jgi:hypothetical protein
MANNFLDTKMDPQTVLYLQIFPLNTRLAGRKYTGKKYRKTHHTKSSIANEWTNMYGIKTVREKITKISAKKILEKTKINLFASIHLFIKLLYHSFPYWKPCLTSSTPLSRISPTDELSSGVLAGRLGAAVPNNCSDDNDRLAILDETG